LFWLMGFCCDDWPAGQLAGAVAGPYLATAEHIFDVDDFTRVAVDDASHVVECPVPEWRQRWQIRPAAVARLTLSRALISLVLQLARLF
jgi:hypothetical protein